VPGDSTECREHAKRCMELAEGTKNPAVKESLLNVARTWVRLAADLEATQRLLDAWEASEAKKPTG
jgi:hypothetical protein